MLYTQNTIIATRESTRKNLWRVKTKSEGRNTNQHTRCEKEEWDMPQPSQKYCSKSTSLLLLSRVSAYLWGPHTLTTQLNYGYNDDKRDSWLLVGEAQGCSFTCNLLPIVLIVESSPVCYNTCVAREQEKIEGIIQKGPKGVRNCVTESVENGSTKASCDDKPI